MASAKAAIEIDAPAAAVWAVIGDFNGLPKFARGITESEVTGDGVGAVRTITTVDGRVIKERLEKYDPAAMALCYSIVEPPMPFNHYRATIIVRPTGPSACEVQWGSTFEPASAPEAELVANFEKSYGGGLKGLKKFCESS
jgi:hypothetical protein